MAIGLAAYRLFLALTFILLASARVGGDEFREGASRGPLDGMAFVGKIGPAEKPDLDDVLYFEEGQFWSKICTACGFIPGPYWTREVDGGKEFRGILESGDRGKFSYTGFVKDGQISVTINWRKERWYWSIDRHLRFEGRLSEVGEARMSLEAARGIADQKPRNPDNCPA